MKKCILNQFSAALIFALFFLVSCHKNSVEPTLKIPDKSITVQEAQAYYARTSLNTKNRAAREQADPIEFKTLDRSPKWDRAINKAVGGQEVVIVPLRHNKYRALRHSKNKSSNAKGLAKDDSQIGLDETSFLYFYKNDRGEMLYEVVIAVPTEAWAKNPRKRFSGYTMVSDGEMNFKRGIAFENGEVTGGFGIGTADKRARTTEICGWIEQWGYNYVQDASGNMPQGPFYISYGSIPIYCTLAPDISTGYQLPANSYDGPGSYYNPPPQLTEEEYFESIFVVDPPDKRIENVPDFLECFSNSSNHMYKIAVSVDQPIAGSTAPINPLATHKVGHTYLTLTQIHKTSGETIQRTIGFYPASGGNLINPSAPSVFHNDSEYSGGWDVQLTFQLTGAELMQIVQFIPNYTNANYHLSNRNCGNFALDALSQIGINVSPFWMNTYWYSAGNSYIFGSSPTEIRGPSIGALGEQLFNTPPYRTATKSHAGGAAPKHLGKCD